MDLFKSRKWLILLSLSWGVGVLSCLFLLYRFENTHGVVDATLRKWPTQSLLRPSKAHFTLVQFIHPKCSCSRASLSQLHRIASRYPEALGSIIVATFPKGLKPEKSSVLEFAAQLPSAQVVEDVDGVEAIRFGATTSGQTFLFSSQGKVLFAGGITPARGHQGDSKGSQAIDAILSRPALAQVVQTPDKLITSKVFGCALVDRHGAEEAGP